MLGLNLAVVGLNAIVAMRGYRIWRLVERVQFVEWIQRFRPHMQPTFVAVRLLNVATLPIRIPAQAAHSHLKRSAQASGRRAPTAARSASA